MPALIDGRGQGSDVLDTPQEEGGIPLPGPPCQEDLRFKNFGPPSAGTIGGPWEEGGSQPNPSSF